MKKIFLLLLVMCFSCSSEDSERITTNPPDKENPVTHYRLVKVEQYDTDDVLDETITYNYNASGELITSTEVDDGTTYVSTLNYSGNKVISISRSFINDLTYTYTGDLVTTRSVLSDGILFTNEYTYNALNQLTNEKQFNDGVLCCSTTYSYNSQQNMFNAEYTNNNSSLDGDTYYTHDTMKNPFKDFLPPSLAKISDIGKSENNILKAGSNEPFVYEYNEKGYPTKKTTHVADDLYIVDKYYYAEL